MRRLILACAGLVVCAAAAEAQPTLAVPSIVVTAGGTVAVTVNGGTPGEGFAILGSTTNGGLAYAGTNLAVGTDVQILAVGVLNGSGSSGPITIAPPFPPLERYYLQGVTSPSPAFVPLVATPGVVLLNAQVARVYMAVGGGVNPNGSGFALSPGVTSTRTGPGAYSVSYAGQFSGPNVIPNITAFCGQSPASVTANNAGFTVTFASDCGFFFTATPIRR